MKSLKAQLRGDTSATIEKAEGLLTQARAELKNSGDSREKLRCSAETGWLALSAGADTFLCATEGKTAKGRKDVENVYKQFGARTAGQFGIVYNLLHVDCHYEDRKTCTKEVINLGLREAGQAIRTLSKRLVTMRGRGKAASKCKVV